MWYVLPGYECYVLPTTFQGIGGVYPAASILTLETTIEGTSSNMRSSLAPLLAAAPYR